MQKLAGRWPARFNLRGDTRHTGMVDGFCHGDGWFDVLWRLCEELEPLVKEFEEQTGQRVEVLQVKQKLGGLRFYVNHRTDAISERIAEAIGFTSVPATAQPTRFASIIVVPPPMNGSNTRICDIC